MCQRQAHCVDLARVFGKQIVGICTNRTHKLVCSLSVKARNVQIVLKKAYSSVLSKTNYYLDQGTKLCVSNMQLFGFGHGRLQKLLQRLGNLALFDGSRDLQSVSHTLKLFELDQFQTKQ